MQDIKKQMVVNYLQTINRFTALDAYPIQWIDEQVNQIASGNIFSTLDLKSAYYQIPLLKNEKQ